MQLASYSARKGCTNIVPGASRCPNSRAFVGSSLKRAFKGATEFFHISGPLGRRPARSPRPLIWPEKGLALAHFPVPGGGDLAEDLDDRTLTHRGGLSQVGPIGRVEPGQHDLDQPAQAEQIAGLALEKGEGVVNSAGVWHTADVAGPATALFITAGLGTELRPR